MSVCAKPIHPPPFVIESIWIFKTIKPKLKIMEYIRLPPQDFDFEKQLPQHPRKTTTSSSSLSKLWTTTAPNTYIISAIRFFPSLAKKKKKFFKRKYQQSVGTWKHTTAIWETFYRIILQKLWMVVTCSILNEEDKLCSNFKADFGTFCSGLSTGAFTWIFIIHTTCP